MNKPASVPRKLLRLSLRVAFTLVFLLLALAGSFWLYYRSIVGVEPGGLPVEARPGELGRWVNPFIGTGGIAYVSGHNHPGAQMPFGMMRLSPDTASPFLHSKALNTSGYYYGDTNIMGFSHTRLVGTGATDGGHFLVIPTLASRADKARREGQFARFSHRDETAFPGFYAVKLRTLGVLAEFTATERAGIHRYTFSKDETPHILINVTSALAGHRAEEGEVRILPETRGVEGAVRTFGSFSRRYGGIKVYFAAQFSEPFESHGVWTDGAFAPGQTAAEGTDIGADFSFAKGPGDLTVELRLAISFTGIEGARANLLAEAADQSFGDIYADAREAWEDRLSSICVEGGTDDQKTIFHTALYRAFQMPTVFNDASGDYLGFDKQVHTAQGFRYFTDMSLWDTFRTTHPLYTLIAPDDQRDMMVSLVTMAEQGGGWLPRWPSGNGYTNSMFGTPADMAVTEAYLKGIRDFDIETAYKAMKATALAPTPPGSPFSGRGGVEHYVALGYCPADKMKKSVSSTLEYACADHSIARLAGALGYPEDAALFHKHAQFYKNLWNPETRHFHPRNADGSFADKFKPLLLTYMDRSGEYTHAYVEGSALQWRWAMPSDPQGLIALFGGPGVFAEELNDFFAKSSPARAWWNPGPYYWHGNQPDIHAAYLFNEAGRPDLTQKWVRWIMDHKYGTKREGLDGNDDGGTLSAWYVWSALGFYPVAGTDKYQLGAPLFARAAVRTGGKDLVIIAENHAPGNVYVQEVRLNDTPLGRTSITHDEIAEGGELRFRMGSEPGIP
jgi:predicted alpha-1,2-mannosidase